MTTETTEQRAARIASVTPLNDKNAHYEIVETPRGVALIITDGFEYTRADIAHGADDDAITKGITAARMAYDMRGED